MSRLKPHLIPLLLYILLVILFTWPLLGNILTAYPSAINWYGGDPNIYIWQIDTAAKYIKGDLPTSPGQMLFYPQGLDLARGYEGLTLTALGLPFALLSKNPVLAYNLMILFGLWSALAAAYGLSYHLTRARLPAFLAGFIFGLSPFLLVRALQHGHLVLAGVVPLLVWAGIKFMREPKTKTAVLLAGSVLLTSLTQVYYLAAGGIFLLILFLFNIKQIREHKTRFVLFALLILLAALLPALPLLSSRGITPLPDSISYARKLGISAANLISPHPFTNVLGAQTAGTYERFPSTYQNAPNYFEAGSYLGLPLLLLLGFSVIWWKRISLPEKTLLAVSGVVVFILALGPEISLGNKTFPLPYHYLLYVFPFSLLRAANRLFIFPLLGAAALGSAVLQFIFQNTNKRSTALACAVLFLLFTAERLMLPFPLVAKTTPGFYYYLAEDHNNFAVADLPILYPGLGEYNYFQMTHNKPVTGGEYYYPAYTESTFGFIEQNAILAAGFCRHKMDENQTIDLQAALSELAQIKIRYLIVHNITLQEEPACQEAGSILRQALSDMQPLLSDGEITVYSTTDQ